MFNHIPSRSQTTSINSIGNVRNTNFQFVSNVANLMKESVEPRLGIVFAVVHLSTE